MLPSGNGYASLFTTNWLGDPCPVQPNPIPQAAYFGSSNPDSVVFNFNGTALDIRGQLFCNPCPTTVRYTLYDTSGVVFEDQPVPVGPNGNLSFQRDDRRPCKKLVLTANGPIPPDTWTGGVWGFWHLYYNPGCPFRWDDPWLQDSDVTNGMLNAWQTEVAKGFDRKEPGGWIYRNTSTGEYELRPPVIIYQDICEIEMSPTPPVVPDYVPVAAWHGHVLGQGIPVPSTCRRYEEGSFVDNGASVDDVRFAAESGYPFYILDEDELFKVEPNGSWDGMSYTYGCRRIL